MPDLSENQLAFDWRAIAGLLLSGCLGVAAAEPAGIAQSGASGGLKLPTADILRHGDVAFSIGTFREAQLAKGVSDRNYLFGVGLAPNIEVWGRFSEYSQPDPNSPVLAVGTRDISANVKWKLPSFWKGQPNLAIGVLDVSGGNSLFSSVYLVGNGSAGDVSWSVGLAKSATSRGVPLDGLFGGAQYQFGSTGLAALIERERLNTNVGVRFTSSPIASLGDATLIGTLQKSVQASSAASPGDKPSSISLAMMVPLERIASRPLHLVPDKALPPLTQDATRSAGMVSTEADRLESLRRMLVASGLERVRVGMSGQSLVVEYENHLYAQNEADALGVVLGLAAESSPVNARRIVAVSLKSGVRVMEVSVALNAYRSFLRDGNLSVVRGDLTMDRAPAVRDPDVRWLDSKPTAPRKVRLAVRPDLVYHLGTDFAPFDYSLAAALDVSVPLWAGGGVQATYVQHLTNSRFYGPGLAWSNERQQTGLKSLMVQHAFWAGSRVHANIGMGRVDYGNFAIQGEASIFVPGGNDMVRVKANLLRDQSSTANPQRTQLSAAYRWVPLPGTWVEAGFQQYADGTRGPSAVLTRWFGDVGMHLHYRRGGSQHFAGFDLSIPLTPRKGLDVGPVSLVGTPQFQRGVRTRVFNAANTVQVDAARDVQPEFIAEIRDLNAGRFGQAYFVGQLPRMREAFYAFGRNQLSP